MTTFPWAFLISQITIIYNTALIVKEITCHTYLCFELGHFCIALIRNIEMRSIFTSPPWHDSWHRGGPLTVWWKSQDNLQTLNVSHLMKDLYRWRALKTVWGDQISKTRLIWTELKGSMGATVVNNNRNRIPSPSRHKHTHSSLLRWD